MGIANMFDLAVYDHVKARLPQMPRRVPEALPLSSDGRVPLDADEDDPLTGGEEPDVSKLGAPGPLPPTMNTDRDSFFAAIGEGVDALLVTAVEVERDAVLRLMTAPTGTEAVLKAPVEDLVYYVGYVGESLVALTMSRAGATLRDGSTLAVNEAISMCSPRAVIAVGMAWGMLARKLRIGDVLVSSRILPFDVVRREDGRHVYRAPQPEPGGLLLNRFRNVTDWSYFRPDGYSCEVKTGPVLSGESLVDSLPYKRRLHDDFPDAIGGEMEGTGIYGGTAKNRGEWIIVKAVCDWADGSKHKRYQPLAAAVSASLVASVLASRHTLADLPRMEGPLQPRSRVRLPAAAQPVAGAGGAIGQGGRGGDIGTAGGGGGANWGPAALEATRANTAAVVGAALVVDPKAAMAATADTVRKRAGEVALVALH